jgi:hypothetical protein
MKKSIEGVGEVLTPSTPKEKIQNFWYHYKWHTVVSLVLIVALLICSLQFCTKESYDAYILYAGSKRIGRTASDGDVAEIVSVISSLKRVTSDFDENGEVNISFTGLYYLGAGEAGEADAADTALLVNDKKTLTSLLEHSEYYLCFISTAVYDEYHRVGDSERFITLNEYKAENPELRYHSDSAIYLSSTALSKLPALSSMPEDTLVVIRHPSVLGAKSDAHMIHFENAKKILDTALKLKIN